MTLPGFGGDEIKSYRKLVTLLIVYLPLAWRQYGISTESACCSADAFYTREKCFL